MKRTSPSTSDRTPRALAPSAPTRRRLATLAWTSVVAAFLVLVGGCGVLAKSPRTGDVDVNYTGNTFFDDDDLDRVIARFFQDFASTRFKKSAVDDAAFDIERRYVASGFPSAKIRYRYVERGGERPLAAFQINEGPRARLGAVRFEGNTAMRDKELAPFFAPRASGLLEDSEGWFVEAGVRASLDEVVLAYRSRGYLDARATLAGVDFDASRTVADVRVTIREGVPYRLVSVDVTGGDPRVDAKKIDSISRAYLNKPYYERLSSEIQGRYEELYAGAGFADVTVERTRREANPDGTVALAYAIRAGPLVTVGPITIGGNVRTRSAFVRSRLQLREGRTYSREEERASFGSLFKSGVFDRVSIRVPPAPDEDPKAESVVRPLQVDVVEARALEVFLEPGWGSYEEFRVSAGARHKNLFGTGRILDLHGTVGAISQSGSLSLIDPWLFAKDVVAEVTLFGTRRKEPSFLRTEAGIGTSLTRRFSPTVEGLVGYRFRRSDAKDVQVLDNEALDALDNVDISEVQGSVAYDTRDNVFQPTRGTFAKLSLEYGGAAVGSELDFARLRAQYAGFLSLNAATVLGWSARTGVVEPLAGTDSIPLQERFFNGGENSVRSFRESELGPKDDSGEPLGGEAFTTFSVELRRRLKGRFEGALFWDTGNLVPRHEDYFEFNGYKQAFGVGVRYALPVGPIRLDAALNPDPGDFESRWTVHVSLGMAF